MANPSGNHQEQNHASSSFNGTNPSNGNLVSESSVTTMKHNPGISTEWSVEEQAILEEGLTKDTSESNLVRYAKIAMQLPDKTVRDVALRCRWMTKKESSKRRKEEHNLTRRSKDKKDRATDPSAKSSQLVVRPNVPPYATPMVPLAYDDAISFKAIGGSTGELLEQNAKAFNQISANLASMKLEDNIQLFCHARDNILKLMNEINDVPDIMKQMPPPPVKLNEELVNAMLPPSNLPPQQQ